MNCTNCNSPLEPQARFCAKCGTSVAENTVISGPDRIVPTAPMWITPVEATTAFPPQQPMLPEVGPQSLPQQAYPPQENHFSPTTPLSEVGRQKHRKRRRGLGPGGCFLVAVTVLILLFGSLAGVWFLVLRPQIHQMVLDKLDSSMAQAVNQVPPLNQLPLPPLSLLPIPQQLKQLPPITEGTLDTVMNATLSPSDQIRNLQFHITEQNVSMNFSVQPDYLPFGIPCTVSFVPMIDAQGNVIVTQVNIQGLATLILSGDDITPIINRHLKDAMTRLNNPVSSIQLQQGAIIITLK